MQAVIPSLKERAVSRSGSPRNRNRGSVTALGLEDLMYALMTEFKTVFWVDNHSNTETYTVSAGGREEALEKATQRLSDDGYENWNLKHIKTA